MGTTKRDIGSIVKQVCLNPTPESGTTTSNNKALPYIVSVKSQQTSLIDFLNTSGNISA